MLANDYDTAIRGNLALVLEDKSGRELARKETPFAIPALGQQSLPVTLAIPAGKGQCTLKATAQAAGGQQAQPTISRRWVELSPDSN